MLLDTNDLEGYAIQANDGSIGHLCDVYFDDRSWAVRYLVVETGPWLMSRKVLISPVALGPADREQRALPVALSRAQVKDSPVIDTQKPVTRQHEISYLDYYRYPYYWTGPALWGAQEYPRMLMDGQGGFISVPQAAIGGRAEADLLGAMRQGRRDDPHLRSGKAIRKYTIRAQDGDVGHLHGMLLDEQSWALRYILVKTGDWWFGHDVVVAPNWIRAVDWFGCKIDVDLSRKQVREAPAFESLAAWDRPREGELFEHYGRRAYWTAGAEGNSTTRRDLVALRGMRLQRIPGDGATLHAAPAED
jgi:hypothetical protein